MVATPKAIERPAGKFILVLVNKSPLSLPSFQIDPASAGNGVLSANPVLKLMSSPAQVQRRKQAFLVNLPTGEYHMKSVVTGTTVLVLLGK